MEFKHIVIDATYSQKLQRSVAFPTLTQKPSTLSLNRDYILLLLWPSKTSWKKTVLNRI